MFRHEPEGSRRPFGFEGQLLIIFVLSDLYQLDRVLFYLLTDQLFSFDERLNGFLHFSKPHQGIAEVLPDFNFIREALSTRLQIGSDQVQFLALVDQPRVLVHCLVQPPF